MNWDRILIPCWFCYFGTRCLWSVHLSVKIWLGRSMLAPLLSPAVSLSASLPLPHALCSKFVPSSYRKAAMGLPLPSARGKSPRAWPTGNSQKWESNLGPASSILCTHSLLRNHSHNSYSQLWQNLTLPVLIPTQNSAVANLGHAFKILYTGYI